MREITQKPQFQHGPAPERVIHLPDGTAHPATGQYDRGNLPGLARGMQLHPIAYAQQGPNAGGREPAGFRDPSRPERPRQVASAKADRNGSRHQPPREEIAKRAYELYVEGGRRDGSDAKDWAQAERELRLIAR